MAKVRGTNEQVATRQELADLLGGRREQAGLTLRELHRQVNTLAAATAGNRQASVGLSTVAAWCQVTNLPSPRQRIAYQAMLSALGIDNVDPWLAAVARLRKQSARGGNGQQHDAPYRGLESYRREDADWFFGRADLTESALKQFGEAASANDRPRILAVVGPSGSGKSSLIHAGLLPALENAGRVVAAMTPGRDPAVGLAAVVSTEPAPDVLVVDQFEELFTECADDDRQRFLDELATATLPNATRPLTVVVCLRIDFYAAAAKIPLLIAPFQQAQVLVGPLGDDALTSVIVEPARRAGLTVDDELVALIKRDLVGVGTAQGLHDPGALPLLSHALLETFRRARNGWMSAADYHAAGGISGAVEASAERIHDQLTPPEQTAVRLLLLRLVHIDGSGPVTRRIAARDELNELSVPQLHSYNHDADHGAARDARVDIGELIERLWLHVC